jgi:hypothetical protein
MAGVEGVFLCVAAVSGIVSAVYSVGRSVLVAALLHALCFSAVKVGVRLCIQPANKCCLQ